MLAKKKQKTMLEVDIRGPDFFFCLNPSGVGSMQQARDGNNSHAMKQQGDIRLVVTVESKQSIEVAINHCDHKEYTKISQDVMRVKGSCAPFEYKDSTYEWFDDPETARVDFKSKDEVDSDGLITAARTLLDFYHGELMQRLDNKTAITCGGPGKGLGSFPWFEVEYI